MKTLTKSNWSLFYGIDNAYQENGIEILPMLSLSLAPFSLCRFGIMIEFIWLSWDCYIGVAYDPIKPTTFNPEKYAQHHPSSEDVYEFRGYKGNWPEDFHQENGNYLNICRICKHKFFGNKHRPYCKLCIEPHTILESFDDFFGNKPTLK